MDDINLGSVERAVRSAGLVFATIAAIAIAGACNAASPQTPAVAPSVPAAAAPGAPAAPPTAAAPGASASAAAAAAPGGPAAPAAKASDIPPQYSDLVKKLTKLLRDTEIKSVRPSGVEGIVEVLLAGNRIVYCDLAGTHLFNGHLFELDTQKDLTEERLTDVTRVDVKVLPLADAFDVKRGNGKRELYLFEDPDCPYCKQFEEQLPDVPDVTLHVFLYPLTSIHPHALVHARGIWCAKDRQKAWSDKMLKNIDPPPTECANPLDRNIALGDKLHIQGTPTMIFADGRVHEGVVSANELERLLAGSR
jgi:thiol:disulfide interchange protein DsbC